MNLFLSLKNVMLKYNEGRVHFWSALQLRLCACLQIFYDLVRQINRKNPDALEAVVSAQQPVTASTWDASRVATTAACHWQAYATDDTRSNSDKDSLWHIHINVCTLIFALT